MSYDNISRAAEHHWDCRQAEAEREAEAADAEAERLAEIAEAERNDALSVIRTQIANPEVAKAFTLQLLDTISSTIFDHYVRGPMDQIHAAIFEAIEKLEAQGVAA